MSASSRGETQTTIGFPGVKNGGSDLLVIVRSMEGAGGGGDGDQVLLLLSGVTTVSGEKFGLIVVIPCVNNGGCTKEGGIGGLGWAVGPNVGIGWR